ncbi:NAD-dependent epimerase/dehydratase family protein [Streptomyces atratus]|uniref:NmrA-like family protein n=1 Tax=Streptomyces atratus TaxID=1893 RepID=A0A1K2EHX8_STRAR|nr:NmrA-like family protein [Streptomyces atratus]
MRAFVAGATGRIGSAVVDELISAGHRATGLARSDQAEQALAAKGAGVVRGDLDDLASLRRGAAQADEVTHMANKHDWGSRCRVQGVSGHIGDGSAAWSAVHRDDAARLIRLGLEQAPEPISASSAASSPPP